MMHFSKRFGNAFSKKLQEFDMPLHRHDTGLRVERGVLGVYGAKGNYNIKVTMRSS